FARASVGPSEHERGLPLRAGGGRPRERLRAAPAGPRPDPPATPRPGRDRPGPRRAGRAPQGLDPGAARARLPPDPAVRPRAGDLRAAPGGRPAEPLGPLRPRREPPPPRTPGCSTDASSTGDRDGAPFRALSPCPLPAGRDQPA